jgi:hypothetical protein
MGANKPRESTELLVTELITNAVKASQAVMQASPVRLWLVSDLARVLILVWDASPQPPARVSASDETENGRGLMLVEAISEQWGWYGRDDSDGEIRLGHREVTRPPTGAPRQVRQAPGLGHLARSGWGRAGASPGIGAVVLVSRRVPAGWRAGGQRLARDRHTRCRAG